MVRATRYLQIIEREQLVANAAKQGELLVAGLQRLADRHPEQLANPRGRGLLAAFSAKSPERRKQIIERARELGLLLLACGPDSIRCRPALDVTSDEVTEALEVLERTITTVG
jgi:L-lysine 6-transaminase